jgi:hypothetical protein
MGMSGSLTVLSTSPRRSVPATVFFSAAIAFSNAPVLKGQSLGLLIDHGAAVRQLEPAPASPAKTKTHALFDRFDVKAHR